MDEIYVFCLKNEKLNPITLYQNLTQNDYLPLTHVRFEQMLKNIYDENGKPIDFKLTQKDKYSFDDILKLSTELWNSFSIKFKEHYLFNKEIILIVHTYL